MAREEEQTLKDLEEQVKRELDIKEIGPNMSTHDAGKLGGYMVKHLIERGERRQGGK